MITPKALLFFTPAFGYNTICTYIPSRLFADKIMSMIDEVRRATHSIYLG